MNYFTTLVVVMSFLVGSAQGAAVQHPVMLVFVHGTFVPLPSVTTVRRTWQHVQRDGMAYGTAVTRALRHANHQQPMGDFMGLCPLRAAPVFEPRMTVAHNAFTELFESIWLATGCSRADTPLHTYIFGWSGKLSAPERRAAAGNLYGDLVRERVVLAEQHACTPEDIEIVLFGYSHGGNICLLLAEEAARRAAAKVVIGRPEKAGVVARRAQERVAEEAPLRINRLVLLATPVQRETAHYACNPMFGSVLNAYSSRDIGQITDCVTTRGCSRRRFSCSCTVRHIKQVELLVGKPGGDVRSPSHEQLGLYHADGMFPNNFTPLVTNPFPVLTFMPALLALTREHAHEAYRATITKPAAGYVIDLTSYDDVSLQVLALPQAPFDAALPALTFA